MNFNLENTQTSRETQYLVGGEYINQENLSNHVCQCDRNFLEKVLDGHKKCLRGMKEFCLNDKYRYCKF